MDLENLQMTQTFEENKMEQCNQVFLKSFQISLYIIHTTFLISFIFSIFLWGSSKGILSIKVYFGSQNNFWMFMIILNVYGTLWTSKNILDVQKTFGCPRNLVDVQKVLWMSRKFSGRPKSTLHQNFHYILKIIYD